MALSHKSWYNIKNVPVSNKLAACVNIIPGVTSVYEWEGKIENDSELILMIKTRTSLVTNLTGMATQSALSAIFRIYLITIARE